MRLRGNSLVAVPHAHRPLRCSPDADQMVFCYWGAWQQLSDNQEITLNRWCNFGPSILRNTVVVNYLPSRYYFVLSGNRSGVVIFAGVVGGVVRVPGVFGAGSMKEAKPAPLFCIIGAVLAQVPALLWYLRH